MPNVGHEDHRCEGDGSARVLRHGPAAVAPVRATAGWMAAMGDWLYLIIGIAVVAVALLAGLLTSGRRRKAVEAPPRRTDVIAPPEPTDVPVADDLLVERAARSVRREARVDGLPDRPAAPAARGRAGRVRPGAAEPAVARPPRRGHLGGHRGHPADRGRRRRADPAAGRGTAHPAARRRQGGRRPAHRAARRAGQARRPDHGPTPADLRGGRPPGRRPRRRGQRHRQDDHRRQAGPDPGERGQDRRARRGRHLPRGRRRAAGHLG